LSCHTLRRGGCFVGSNELIHDDEMLNLHNPNTRSLFLLRVDKLVGCSLVVKSLRNTTHIYMHVSRHQKMMGHSPTHIQSLKELSDEDSLVNRCGSGWRLQGINFVCHTVWPPPEIVIECVAQVKVILEGACVGQGYPGFLRIY
jgi:hypothetical protein